MLLEHCLKKVQYDAEPFDCNLVMNPTAHQKEWRHILTLVIHFQSFQSVCGAEFHRDRVEGVLDQMKGRIVELGDEIRAKGVLNEQLRQ